MEKLINKLEDNPNFQQGVADAKTGFYDRYKGVGTPIHWVKQLVSKKDWNTQYSKGTYTFLEETKEGIWIGFTTPHLSQRVEKITSNYEFRKIDDHRKATNTYPRPFEDIEEINNSSNEK